MFAIIFYLNKKNKTPKYFVIKCKKKIKVYNQKKTVKKMVKIL